MTKTIDCLLIGHNEGNFQEYEKSVREMGEYTGAYRDLNLSYILLNNKPYTAAELFNIFYMKKGGNTPFGLGETFNAAIAYLGTYLNRRGYTFDCINSFQDEKENLAKKLVRDDILCIAVTTTLYITVVPIVEIIDFIKKHNHKAKIILGGPFVATQCRMQEASTREYIFKYALGADFYIDSSQGEATLVRLVNALKNNLPFDQIPNLYYKADEGFYSTPSMREDNKLSENMVDWSLFADHVGEYVNIRTTISCPFSCAFCGFPQHAGAFQMADIAAVEKELKVLDQIGTVRHVSFIDDTFNVPVRRFKEILEMLIANKFKFKWYSHFRCQFADRETVELMKESGCEGVFLGLESGCDRILKNMNKAVTVDKYLKGIDLLKEYQIMNYGSFIIGFPGETDESVQDTIRFIKKAGLDFYRVQLWYCEPITPIWQQKDKFQIMGESFEWSHATMDARRASDLVEEIFLSSDDPVWVPQYNFECDALFHLLHRGFSWEQLKRFLTLFNRGVKEKIKDKSKPEVSFEVIRQLEKFFQGNREVTPSQGKTRQVSLMEKFDADFDL